MGPSRWVATALAAVTVAAAAVAAAAPAAAAASTNGTVYTFAHGDVTTGVAVTPPAPPGRGRHRSGGRRGRIRGGTIVGRGDAVSGATFAVKLFNEDGSTFFCMGSLVDRRHVLTAASCGVTAGMKARVGGLDLYKGWYLNIKTATPYPWYQEATQINDLAMLELEDPPALSDYADSGVVPIELAPNDYVPPQLRISGWGANASDGTGPAWGGGVRELRSGFQPTTDPDLCDALLGGFRTLDLSRQVCTNFESLEDTALCYLDTGGALWDRRWTGPGTYQYRIYGVAAYWAIPEGSGEMCPFGEPNVFTKVRPLAWWIQKIMREAESRLAAASS